MGVAPFVRIVYLACGSTFLTPLRAPASPAAASPPEEEAICEAAFTMEPAMLMVIREWARTVLPAAPHVSQPPLFHKSAPQLEPTPDKTRCRKLGRRPPLQLIKRHTRSVVGIERGRQQL